MVGELQAFAVVSFSIISENCLSTTGGDGVNLNRRQFGQQGESLAARVLEKRGYKILARNYRTPLGEIDLVARDGKVLVFIEVKTRRSHRFGAPQEAVSPPKQDRLRRLAAWYMQQHKQESVPVRFDVVAITLTGNEPQVEIIQEAFGA